MARPSVLVIHNRYLEPGGEDEVVRAEIALLRQHGHRVLQYARHNREIAGFNALRRAGLAFTTAWDPESYAELRALIRQERPTIAHCHNLLPLLSPSVYYACAAEGVPVVQTVHNYRLLCPEGNLFRNGSACNNCGGNLATATVRGCYHDSRLQTAAVALMLSAHRALGTWREKVTTYIAPSEFCRSVLTASLLPPAKVSLKPHFMGGVFPPRHGRGDYAIFVGRLSEEKGILPLLEVWRELQDIPLVVVGSGPLEAAARQLADRLPAGQIRFTGRLPHSGTLELIRNARFVVAPSRCHVTFGLTVLEAMACGVPAIVPHAGALRELVCDRRTGLIVDVEDPEKLPRAIRWAWSHALETREMGRAARHHYMEHYSPQTNYNKLMGIYRSAMQPADVAAGSVCIAYLAAAASVSPAPADPVAVKQTSL